MWLVSWEIRSAFCGYLCTALKLHFSGVYMATIHLITTCLIESVPCRMIEIRSVCRPAFPEGLQPRRENETPFLPSSVLEAPSHMREPPVKPGRFNHRHLLPLGQLVRRSTPDQRPHPVFRTRHMGKGRRKLLLPYRRDPHRNAARNPRN